MRHGSILLQDIYGTEAMRSLWNERNLVEKWLEVESALVFAHAELGSIPAEAATTIILQCRAGELPTDLIARSKSEIKHLMVAFIDAFAQRCGPAGEYFHLGATTQDILDTGMTLQARESLTLVLDDLLRLQDLLLHLAEDYKATVMMGRTHAQHAGPLTFGLKVATWASEVTDHLDRLLQCAQRLLFMSVSGAVGTNASFVNLLGADGARRLRDLLSQQLGLPEPPVDYHQRTDRFCELLSVLASVGTTLGKIGLEIRDLQRTEVGEIAAPWATGRQHGSSTMPHKRNPADAETLAALARILNGNAATLSAQTMQHERDATWMTLAFACVPDSFLLLAAALKSMLEIFSGLEVDEAAMSRNLHLEHGLAMSEALMLAVYRKTGKKHSAHRICFEACNMARQEGRTLRDVFLGEPRFQGLLGEDDLDEALDPLKYIGDSREQVDELVQYARERRQAVDTQRRRIAV